MKIIITVILLCLFNVNSFAQLLTYKDITDSIRLYLEINGATNSSELIRPTSGLIYIRNLVDEEPKIVTWEIPDIPKPIEEELIPNEIAAEILKIPLKHRRRTTYYPYFIEMTQAEKDAADLKELIANQNVKSPELKAAESEVFKILRNTTNLGAGEYLLVNTNLAKYMSSISITNTETMFKFLEIQKNLKVIETINGSMPETIYDHDYLNNITP